MWSKYISPSPPAKIFLPGGGGGVPSHCSMMDQPVQQKYYSAQPSQCFQSDCRINLVDRIGENYILKATLDEFDEYRMKKNMSDEMKYKEKVRVLTLTLFLISSLYQVECFTALASIAHKINERDADMRSHIVLSMFKVSSLKLKLIILKHFPASIIRIND